MYICNNNICLSLTGFSQVPQMINLTKLCLFVRRLRVMAAKKKIESVRNIVERNKKRRKKKKNARSKMLLFFLIGNLPSRHYFLFIFLPSVGIYIQLARTELLYIYVRILTPLRPTPAATILTSRLTSSQVLKRFCTVKWKTSVVNQHYRSNTIFVFSLFGFFFFCRNLKIDQL